MAHTIAHASPSVARSPMKSSSLRESIKLEMGSIQFNHNTRENVNVQEATSTHRRIFYETWENP